MWVGGCSNSEWYATVTKHSRVKPWDHSAGWRSLLACNDMQMGIVLVLEYFLSISYHMLGMADLIWLLAYCIYRPGPIVQKFWSVKIDISTFFVEKGRLWPTARVQPAVLVYRWWSSCHWCAFVILFILAVCLPQLLLHTWDIWPLNYAAHKWNKTKTQGRADNNT